MSKLVDKEGLAKLAKALDDRAKDADKALDDRIKSLEAFVDAQPEYITETELNNKDFATKSYVSSEISKAQLEGGGSIIYPSSMWSSVKDFGAVGDGVTDDSNAIQSAIDSVRDGGSVYFPKGIYLLNAPVKYYSNQDLIFENGATLLRGVSSMTVILTNYCDSTTGGYGMTKNVNIINATLDANSSFTSNDCTLLGFIHSEFTNIINCTFKNQPTGWHSLEINASKNTVVDGCRFIDVKTSKTNGEMLQIDAALNNTVYPWTANYDNTVSKNVTIRNCYFGSSSISPAIGNHSNAAHSIVMIYDNIFDNITSSRGVINFVSNMSYADIHDNTFIQCTTGVITNASKVTVHDNNFILCSGAISSGTPVSFNNIVNGVLNGNTNTDNSEGGTEGGTELPEPILSLDISNWDGTNVLKDAVGEYNFAIKNVSQYTKQDDGSIYIVDSSPAEVNMTPPTEGTIHIVITPETFTAQYGRIFRWDTDSPSLYFNKNYNVCTFKAGGSGSSALRSENDCTNLYNTKMNIICRYNSSDGSYDMFVNGVKGNRVGTSTITLSGETLAIGNPDTNLYNVSFKLYKFDIYNEYLSDNQVNALSSN